MDNKDCNIVLIYIDFCKIVFLIRFCRYFVLMIIVFWGFNMGNVIIIIDYRLFCFERRLYYWYFFFFIVMRIILVNEEFL